MASCGNARVQLRWSPSLVPGAGGDKVFIEEAIVWILEGANRAAGVEDRSVVNQASVPFPGACLCLHRWVAAFNS